MSFPLLHLPRELRDEIYINVLASPTGFIVLPDDQDNLSWGLGTPKTLLRIEPYNPQISKSVRVFPKYQKISLALLRVCKQTYTETRDLFWQHNALFICIQRPTSHVDSILAWDTLSQQLSTQLSHVQLEINPFHINRGHFEAVKKALETFVTWSHTGSLKKLDLRFHVAATQKIVQRTYNTRTIQRDYISLLESICGSGHEEVRLAAHVEKKLVLDQPSVAEVEDNPWSFWKSPVEVERLLDPNKMLVRLHNAFLGELWVDGVLRYVNGRRAGV
jgi:hypothetical protein